MAYLSLSNLSKQFADSYAVQDFNLDVEKGEFVSFLGPSGCGKTTTLRMIAGFEIPTGGSIRLDNIDITYNPPNQRHVGMVFQSYALFPNMTVSQNIGFGLRVRKASESEITDRVKEMVSLVNLEKHVDKYPFQLSGGQQQRVSLARALVTHDQEEALSISDRVVVMYDGNVEQVGTPFDIYNFPRTSFVANFVGSLNTADAEVIDPEKGLLGMDGVQLASAAKMDGLQKGEKVRIAIRPERFSFASEVRKANIVDCRIENITFLGSVVRVHILVGKTKFTMDTFNYPSLALPRIGDTDQVTCSKEAVLILRDAKS